MEGIIISRGITLLLCSLLDTVLKVKPIFVPLVVHFCRAEEEDRFVRAGSVCRVLCCVRSCEILACVCVLPQGNEQDNAHPHRAVTRYQTLGNVLSSETRTSYPSDIRIVIFGL